MKYSFEKFQAHFHCPLQQRSPFQTRQDESYHTVSPFCHPDLPTNRVKDLLGIPWTWVGEGTPNYQEKRVKIINLLSKLLPTSICKSNKAQDGRQELAVPSL